MDAPNLELPGYNLHIVAPSNDRGKGIAFYFNDEFQVGNSVCSDLFQISKISCPSYAIVNVYRSHGANDQQFLSALDTIIKECVCDVYVVGDFNVDLLKSPNHQIFEFMVKNGFLQLIKEPTHNGGGLLDHVYVRVDQAVSKIDSFFPYYSDHSAIHLARFE